MAINIKLIIFVLFFGTTIGYTKVPKSIDLAGIDFGGLNYKMTNDRIKLATGLLDDKKFKKLDSFLDFLMINEIKGYAGDWLSADVISGLSSHKNNTKFLEERLPAIEEWVKTHPGSLSARIVLAHALISQAFIYRSGNYASRLKDEQLQLFTATMTLAFKVISTNYELKEVDPSWHDTYLSFSSVYQIDPTEYIALLHEAINKWPDYYGIYHVAIRRVSPLWYGKQGEWLDLLTSIADANKEDGDCIYASTIWRFYKKRNFHLFGETDVFSIDEERFSRGVELLKSKSNVQDWFFDIFQKDKVIPIRRSDLQNKLDIALKKSKDNVEKKLKKLFAKRLEKEFLNGLEDKELFELGFSEYKIRGIYKEIEAIFELDNVEINNSSLDKYVSVKESMNDQLVFGLTLTNINSIFIDRLSDSIKDNFKNIYPLFIKDRPYWRH